MTPTVQMANAANLGVGLLRTAYLQTLSTARAPQMLSDTHALLLNGCVFDELPASLVAATARQARAGGAAVFFDPGVRHGFPSIWLIVGVDASGSAYSPPFPG